MSLNQKIDKAQSEASAIKDLGFKEYVWNRKVSMPLAWFGIAMVFFFVAGAVLL
jgi:hypothetical protein